MNRYDKPTILKTQDNRPYYRGKFYPNIPLSENDYYIITTIGDRLDSIASSYYGDPTLWWIIAAANNNATNGALFPIPGTQLRIPTDVNSVLQLFDQFNKTR